ncbi:MAG: hypothetical protein M0P13_02345 [Fibrobacteraceae bacterium]|nr:hypothetical protein [Fibrobacteraceae bacterium]
MKNGLSETWFVFGVELLLLSLMGKLSNYIHPKFHVAVIITAVLLIAQKFFIWKTSNSEHSSFSYSVFVLWLVMIIMLFDAFSYKANGHTVVEYFSKESFEKLAETDLVRESSSERRSSSSLEESSISVKKVSVHEKGSKIIETNLPWLSLQVREKKWNYSWKVKMMGFVLRDPSLVEKGEVALVRVIVTCCVADAVGIAVRIPDNLKSPYSENAWLQIWGSLVHKKEESKNVAWDKYANIFFIREILLKIDSVSVVNGNVPSPYIFYSSNDEEFRSQY